MAVELEMGQALEQKVENNDQTSLEAKKFDIEEKT